MPKKIILIIGAPGSGKTTDVKIVASKHSGEISNISIGTVLDEEVKNQTPAGKIAEKFMKKGELVPGSVIMYELLNGIKNTTTDIVMVDGFPRGIGQMKSLSDTLYHSKDGMELVCVIEIRVSSQTSRSRINPQSPQEEELYTHKMEIYEELINDIENYYENAGILTIIDGEQSPEAVADDIDKVLTEQVHLWG